MNPKNFTKTQPMESVFQKCEHEVIAQNIMVILSRTGNEWRELTWDEYKKERKKDGNFSNIEKGYFDEVLPYTISAEKALDFSPFWAKLKV